MIPVSRLNCILHCFSDLIFIFPLYLAKYMLVLKLLFLMETEVCGHCNCIIIFLSIAVSGVDSGIPVQMSELVIF